MPKKLKKDDMKCNKPVDSWIKGKKKAVKACDKGKEKLIHFGAKGYGNNYSKKARDSFRARHKCNQAHDKLTPRYWSCEYLWVKGGHKTACPSNRQCKKD